MKKFILLILFTLSFVACNPEYCYDYFILNTSQNSVELFFYGEEISQIMLENNKQITQISFCDDRGNKSHFEYHLIDSIQVKVNDIVKKTYYPNDTGKSIFKTQDRESWKLVESRKHYSKFVFEITEADLQ